MGARPCFAMPAHKIHRHFTIRAQYSPPFFTPFLPPQTQQPCVCFRGRRAETYLSMWGARPCGLVHAALQSCNFLSKNEYSGRSIIISYHRTNPPLIKNSTSSAQKKFNRAILVLQLQLSIPFVCQLRPSVKSDQTTIFKAFTYKDVLHDFVFVLRVYTNCFNPILNAEIFDQGNRSL